MSDIYKSCEQSIKGSNLYEQSMDDSNLYQFKYE